MVCCINCIHSELCPDCGWSRCTCQDVMKGNKARERLSYLERTCPYYNQEEVPEFDSSAHPYYFIDSSGRFFNVKPNTPPCRDIK
jgi:hypothetical protein